MLALLGVYHVFPLLVLSCLLSGEILNGDGSTIFGQRSFRTTLSGNPYFRRCMRVVSVSLVFICYYIIFCIACMLFCFIGVDNGCFLRLATCFFWSQSMESIYIRLLDATYFYYLCDCPYVQTMFVCIINWYTYYTGSSYPIHPGPRIGFICQSDAGSIWDLGIYPDFLTAGVFIIWSQKSASSLQLGPRSLFRSNSADSFSNLPQDAKVWWNG